MSKKKTPNKPAAAPPEEIVEATFARWPKPRAVLESAEVPAAKLAKRLASAGVVLEPAEIEAQLVDAGFTLHGTPAGRERARAETARALARAVGAALEEGVPVFSVRTVEAGAEAPTGERLWHIGPAKGLPPLVASALAVWVPPRRPAMVVVEGAQVVPPGPVWQDGLQRLADRMQASLSVRHAAAGVSRWTRATVRLASIEGRLPSGARYTTEVLRIYARRPSRAPAPRRIDVRDAPAAAGRRRVVAEGRPASRWYRLDPAPG